MAGTAKKPAKGGRSLPNRADIDRWTSDGNGIVVTKTAKQARSEQAKKGKKK